MLNSEFAKLAECRNSVLSVVGIWYVRYSGSALMVRTRVESTSLWFAVTERYAFRIRMPAISDGIC